MRVLSLFDGMSCGRIALDRAGVKVDAYYASEIDKWAQIISEKNYPDIIRLGDVKGWQSWDLPEIDMIIAGSPCQGFSNAGKGLNFEDPRSKLFFVFVDILKEYRRRNPDIYFMLENVLMKKEWQQVITDILEVEPIMINSALLSAQNRKRLYWTNIPDVGYPCGKDIILADIIETDDYVKTDKKLNPKKYQDKASTLTGGGHSGGNHSDMDILVFGGAIRGRRLDENGNRKDNSNHPIQQRIESCFNEKSNTLTTVQKDNVLIQVGMADDVKGHDIIRRIYSADGKAPTLSANSGGNTQPKVAIVPEATKKGYAEIYPFEGVDLSFPNSKTRRGRRMSSKCNALTAAKSDFRWYDGITYRRLSVIECERLQTVPDNYTDGVSNTQRYKMLGNGWTVDVIAHIFSYLPQAGRAE